MVAGLIVQRQAFLVNRNHHAGTENREPGTENWKPEMRNGNGEQETVNRKRWKQQPVNHVTANDPMKLSTLIKVREHCTLLQFQFPVPVSGYGLRFTVHSSRSRLRVFDKEKGLHLH